MDSTLLAGIIGSGATVVAAILGKVGLFDKPFFGKKSAELIGRWDSVWIDLDDSNQRQYKEDFYITKQKGSKVSGYITKDDEPDKRWEFDGNFTGRFLQINYYPSKKSDTKLFLDYGCYFFDMLGDGSFQGYSVGYYWNENETSVSKHILKLKK